MPGVDVVTTLLNAGDAVSRMSTPAMGGLWARSPAPTTHCEACERARLAALKRRAAAGVCVMISFDILGGPACALLAGSMLFNLASGCFTITLGQALFEKSGSVSAFTGVVVIEFWCRYCWGLSPGVWRTESTLRWCVPSRRSFRLWR